MYLEGALQTRKWQDQSGQDRYSTEVVLQGFNSQLTMLDKAGGGAAAAISAATNPRGVISAPPVRARRASPPWPVPAARAATSMTRIPF